MDVENLVVTNSPSASTSEGRSQRIAWKNDSNSLVIPVSAGS